jgi:hypothetical protein
MVVEAYGTSEMCSGTRADVWLTSILLNASRTAASMMCFLDSAKGDGGKTPFMAASRGSVFGSCDADEGKIDSSSSHNSGRSDLFSGGSIVFVCLTSWALSSISSSSFPKPSASCIP